jgi:hypothetical protein
LANPPKNENSTPTHPPPKNQKACIFARCALGLRRFGENATSPQKCCKKSAQNPLLPETGLFGPVAAARFNRCAPTLEIYGLRRNHIFCRAPVFRQMLILQPQ